MEQPRHSGAGIIPLRYRNGLPEFLLGREREVKDWIGSMRWSGLEGSAKNGETVIANALRESFEESSGLLYKDAADRGRVGDELVRGVYHLKVSVVSDSKETMLVSTNSARDTVYRRLKKAHVTFVKLMDLPDDFVEQFKATRAYLLTFSRRRRVFPPLRGEDGWHDVGPTASLPVPPNALCENHPGVRKLQRRNGNVEYVVNEDYIEKSELRWVSLKELQAAVDGSSSMQLRPLFTIVAEAICNQFQQSSQHPSQPPPKVTPVCGTDVQAEGE